MDLPAGAGDRAPHRDRPGGARREAGRQRCCRGCPTDRTRCASGSRSTISARSTCRSTSPIAAACWRMSSPTPTPRLIVAHADLAGRLAEIDRAALTDAVVLNGADGADPRPRPARARGARAGRRRAAAADARRSRRGTCRPSSTPRARPGRRRACCRPTCSSTPMGTESLPRARRRTTASWSTCRCSMSAAPPASMPMLAIGGSIAIVEAFDTASFWRVVTRNRHHRLRAARRDGDLPRQAAAGADRTAATRCKSAIMVPLCEDAAAFSRALRLRRLHRVQHDRGVDADPLGTQSVAARHLRPAAARRRGAASSTRTTARWRQARSAS